VKNRLTLPFMTSSLRMLKSLCALLVLVLGAESASPFAFWGVREAYQASTSPDIGFSRLLIIGYPGGSGFFNVTLEPSYTPKNLGDEFRWNVPTLYYTYDPSFLDFFGSNGVFAVDSAAGILNSLTNVDSYSADLSEFPLDEMRFNQDAVALNLFDLKSAALEMMVTRLGLADPERWVFAIHNRGPVGVPPLPCPNFNYTIVNLNYDPVTQSPSRYINDNLFTFNVDQDCPPEVTGDRSSLTMRPVDPSVRRQSAVASSKITFPDTAYLGMFHTGLTRDDVGGLRYLYSATNVNTEISAPDVLQFQTNSTPFVSEGLSLALLASQSRTNDAATLAALFPGLVVSSETRFFTNTITTNVTLVFTNPPWAPVPFFAPTIVQVTTRTTNVNVTNYVHTFANTVTFQQVNGQLVAVPFNTVTNGAHAATRQTVSAVVTGGFTPAGTPAFDIRVANTPVLQPGPPGEFLILPTNICDVAIVSAQPITTTTTTFLVGTNIFGVTNIFATNFFTGQVLTQSVAIIESFPHHSFVLNAINCNPLTVGVRGGVKRVAFVRHDYDPLLSRFFVPITNDFAIGAFDTNGVPGGNPTTQRFRRVVTRPDILFTAQDLVSLLTETIDHGPLSYPFLNNSQVLPFPGPGTFEGPITLTFNKANSILLANNPSGPSGQTAAFLYQWGSFDGSTNPPAVYPDGRTINDLERQMAFIISPQSIANAAVGANYDAVFSVSGGQAPYTWSLVSNPAYAVPPGLGPELVQDPSDSSRATLSGAPAAPGNYLFAVQVSDSGGLTRNMIYVLTVSP
jgi:hypothetical protein